VKGLIASIFSRPKNSLSSYQIAISFEFSLPTTYKGVLSHWFTTLSISAALRETASSVNAYPTSD
jgi:hypothetical protein